jgi:hypothetical protein
MEVLPAENWAETGPTCNGLFRLLLFTLLRIDRVVRRTRSGMLGSNLALLLTPQSRGTGFSPGLLILAAFLSLFPVETQLTNGFPELTKVDGFADIAVAAELVTFDDVFLFVRSGQNDHRYKVGALFGM